MGKLYVFSGAGLSAESGISTFRDSNGLWENHKIDEICNFLNFEKNMKRIDSFHKIKEPSKTALKKYELAKENIEKTFDFYNERRIQLGEVNPNIIHETLAELEKEIEVIHITQNIDNLLERAGCTNILHLHGELTKMMCLECKTDINKMGEEIATTFDVGYNRVDFKGIKCPKCGTHNVKPFVVFFYENAPNYHFKNQIFREITDDDIVLVIGTMGKVVAISYDMQTTYGKKILNNLEKSPYIEERLFDLIYYKPGSEAIKDIKNEILTYLT